MLPSQEESETRFKLEECNEFFLALSTLLDCVDNPFIGPANQHRGYSWRLIAIPVQSPVKVSALPPVKVSIHHLAATI